VASTFMSPSPETRENREFASEIKFVISPAVADQVRQWARGSLEPDPHASEPGSDAYTITSLYFDTDDFDVFHRRGSFGRAKYRIRRYGFDTAAFLERKLKTHGMVAKRRSAAALDDLSALGEGEDARPWSGEWFHRRLRARRLHPVAQISYRRTARVTRTSHGPIRLTLDDNLRAIAGGDFSFNYTSEATRLLENRIILELKFRHTIPVLFKLLVEEFALNAVPISKYRLAVIALGLTPSSTVTQGAWAPARAFRSPSNNQLPVLSSIACSCAASYA